MKEVDAEAGFAGALTTDADLFEIAATGTGRAEAEIDGAFLFSGVFSGRSSEGAETVEAFGAGATFGAWATFDACAAAPKDCVCVDERLR